MSDRYDAGLLNDFGGGNVQWWRDYIRAELEKAHEFYATVAQEEYRRGVEDTTKQEAGMNIKRFTVYRKNISQRDTHTALHKNADGEPQYEGVIFTDGTVALRWLTPLKSTSVWPDLYSALGVHGHPEYGTEVVWHDGEAPKEWLDQLAAWETKKALGGPGGK